jgi:MoaA/NifB/PqqE/SkfB family radical SAM enzyme
MREWWVTTKKRSVAADAWKVADLMLRDRFRFRFEGLPFEVRPVGRARRRNLIAAGIDRMLGRPHPTAGPLIAQVEPVDHCNLSCPQCLPRVRRGRGVGTYMDPAVFRSLVDELADSVLLMVLWMWGEPLLHPDLWEMVGYAKRAGIAVHVSTNGNVPLGSDGAERMVRSGLDSIVFAVDGATQETYERYRVGGDLETARGNVLELVAARERLGSPTPRLNMRFVIMHHNEHELEAARRWA